MELELTRVDYTLVGITLQNSLRLLPAKKAKEQQKFVIGDQDGVVQLLSAKKDEVNVHFKTVPGDKVTSVQLGGTHNSVNDKIFIASDNQIVGYNKKGKVFLSFDTNLTEPIKSLCVSGNDLIVCGNHVYTHFKDCKESGSYLCGDTIVDCNVLCPNNVRNKFYRFNFQLNIFSFISRQVESSRFLLVLVAFYVCSNIVAFAN
jgi:Bardet-Biedl syndrome 7 protein